MEIRVGMNAKEEQLCQGKDIFERMNYLYQASRFVAKNDRVAAAHYGNVLIGCAKKSVSRLDPQIKRTICKNCRTPLLPGETARVRLTSKPVKAVKWTCLACNSVRKIPSEKANRLWIEEPESLVQTYDYTPKSTNFDSAVSSEIVSMGNEESESDRSEEKSRKIAPSMEESEKS